jgi:hypothetical protein
MYDSAARGKRGVGFHVGLLLLLYSSYSCILSASWQRFLLLESLSAASHTFLAALAHGTDITHAWLRKWQLNEDYGGGGAGL